MTGDTPTKLIREAAKMEFLRHLVGASPVDELLQRDPSLLEERGSTGRPPLHWLIVENFPSAVRRILQLGADANARDAIGQSPASLACLMGHVECLLVLLDAGVSPDYRDFLGDPLLDVAVQNGNIDIGRLLLSRGADGAYRTDSGDTVFDTIRIAGVAERDLIVEELSKLGVSRESVFAKWSLGELYGSCEEAFGW